MDPPTSTTTSMSGTTTSTASTPCNPWSNSSCGVQWWEVVGPIFGFLCVFILLVASCKCFMEMCRKCCFGARQGEAREEETSNRRRRRRRRRSGSPNRVEDGHENPDFAGDDLDLPPDYFNIRSGSVVFRVATIEDDLHNLGSRSRASSASEKLPTYDDIIKAKEDMALEEGHKTIFVISNERVAMTTPVPVEERPATSQDTDEDVAVSRSSSQSSIDPPPYSDKSL